MSNKNAEIKTIKYYGTKQYFVETDARTGEVIKDSSFKTKAKNEHHKVCHMPYHINS